MGCGRKEYKRIKEQKGYKEFIIALAVGDGTYWTYDDDANRLRNELYGEPRFIGYRQTCFHFNKDNLCGKYELVHLKGDTYNVQPKTQKEYNFVDRKELNTDERNNSTDKQSAYTVIEKTHTRNEENTSTPHIPVYVPEPTIERSCENCFRYISNECTLVRKHLCEDYSAAPPATREEKENRRSMGDASGIAQGIPWYKR